MDVEKKVLKRANHCWHCGSKLRGDHFAETIAEGHKRVFHKSCLKSYRAELREARTIKQTYSWKAR